METKVKDQLKRNTILFGIGDICTKIIQFIVGFFLSFLIVEEDMGQISLITSTVSLLIPFISLSIIESVFRFSIEKDANLCSVFSVGMLFSIIGWILLIPSSIGFDALFGSSSIILIYVYMGLTMTHGIIHYFLKGNKTKIFVINSLIYAVSTSFLTIVLLLFRSSVDIYLIAHILSLIICICFMVISGKLWRFIKFKSINKRYLKIMLGYSCPLILNSVGWWLISLSDTYITSFLLGKAEVGILSYAHKIPSIVSMAYGIFGSAFQLLAISSFDLKNDDEKVKAQQLYEEIGNKITSYLIIIVGLINCISEPLINFLLAPAYYDAWRYVGFYSYGILLFSLASYYGYIYNVIKKNNALFISTFICGILNIVLCIVFYKYTDLGLFSAAFSTFIAYLFIFMYRYFDSRKFLKVTISRKNFILFIILFLQVSITSLIRLESRTVFAINFLFESVTLALLKDELLIIFNKMKWRKK